MKINITKIIGYILISPALASVVMFFAQFVLKRNFFNEFFMYTIWTGDTDFINAGGAGYTSALPFYFGLMAIAGAYLIKDRK
jgi:hypothetical protein